jgi:hypothetical protein
VGDIDSSLLGDAQHTDAREVTVPTIVGMDRNRCYSHDLT